MTLADVRAAVWMGRRRCVDESVDVAVLPHCWFQIAKASSANAVVTRSAQGAATASS